MSGALMQVPRAAFAGLLAAMIGTHGVAEPICPFDAMMSRDGRFVMGLYDHDLAFIWDLDLLGKRLTAAQVHKFVVKGVDLGETIVFAPNGQRLAYKHDGDVLRGTASRPSATPALPMGTDASPDQIVVCEMAQGFPCSPVFDIAAEMSVRWLEWSPKGDRLIFITTNPTRLRTIRFDEDGTVANRSSIKWNAGEPVVDWVRDRLFVGDFGRLMIMDLETLERNQIVPTLVTSTPLAFAQDGDHLVVRSANELSVHYIGSRGLPDVTQISQRIFDRDVYIGPRGAIWYLQSFDPLPGGGSEWRLTRARANGGLEHDTTLSIRSLERGARFLGVTGDNTHAVISVSNDCSHEFRVIALKDGQTRFNFFPGLRTYWKQSFGIPHLGPQIGWEAGYRTTPLPTRHLGGLLGYAELALELGERHDLIWFAILELMGQREDATDISHRLTRLATILIDMRMARNALTADRPAEAIATLEQVIPQISALKVPDEAAETWERIHRAVDGTLSTLDTDARLIRAEAAIELGDKERASADINAVLAANRLDWRAHAGRLRLNLDAPDAAFLELLKDSQEALRIGNWTEEPEYSVPLRFFDEDALWDVRRKDVH